MVIVLHAGPRRERDPRTQRKSSRLRAQEDTQITRHTIWSREKDHSPALPEHPPQCLILEDSDDLAMVYLDVFLYGKQEKVRRPFFWDFSICSQSFAVLRIISLQRLQTQAVLYRFSSSSLQLERWPAIDFLDIGKDLFTRSGRTEWLSVGFPVSLPC